LHLNVRTMCLNLMINILLWHDGTLFSRFSQLKLDLVLTKYLIFYNLYKIWFVFFMLNELIKPG